MGLQPIYNWGKVRPRINETIKTGDSTNFQHLQTFARKIHSLQVPRLIAVIPQIAMVLSPASLISNMS